MLSSHLDPKEKETFWCISLAGVGRDLRPSVERHLCRPQLQVQQPQRAASSLCSAVPDPTEGERESSLQGSYNTISQCGNILKLLHWPPWSCLQGRVKLISTTGRDILLERQKNPRIKAVGSFAPPNSHIKVSTRLTY